MKKITVLGAGVGGFSLVNNILDKKSFEITLIDRKDYYLPPKDVILYPGRTNTRLDLGEWSKVNGVDFIKGEVKGVSARKRKIYTSNGPTLDFDILVAATGIYSKRVNVRGEHREGFFYLSDLNILKLKELLHISREAAVYVSTFLGVKLALALRALGKEIAVVSSAPAFLGEFTARTMSLLEKNNIAIYKDSAVEEAVGENMVKAVKISPLKIFSSQILVMDSGFVPNLNFFEEGIEVKDSFFTQFEDIFCLGDAGDKDIENQRFFAYNYINALRQGERLAGFFKEGRVEKDNSGLSNKDNNMDFETFFKEVELWQNG